MPAEAKRECDRLNGEAREQAMREASQTEIVSSPSASPRDTSRRPAATRETRLEMEDQSDGILSRP